MRAERSCNTQSAIVFIVGLISGTMCILTAKTLFEMKSVGLSGKEELFKPAVFETFVMFFGMVFALPLYLLMECIKRLRARGDPVAEAALAAETPITFKMLAILAVPSVFDLSSVILMMAGLMHINASIWMILRGGGIVFVALMKQFALGDNLTLPMWFGVAIITLAVLIVGYSSTLNDDSSEASSAVADKGIADTVLGISLTVGGTVMQSLQYVYEEKVMSGDNPAPPWLLIGMEGLFGSLLTVFVVYPIAGRMPGDDHGAFENFENTLAQLQNNPTLLQISGLFCVSVFLLNSFSVLVTVMLSSVWHAILDNFRPITIWAVQLALYSWTDGVHGERWGDGSYLQLIGLGVMLLGTAIYNGTVTFPGLPAKDLLATADDRASPSLSRSPLITKNQSPTAVPFVGTTSPYAKRFQPELTEKLVVNVR